MEHYERQMLRICLEEHHYKFGEFDAFQLPNGKEIKVMRTENDWAIFIKRENGYIKESSGKNVGRLLMKLLIKYNIKY